MLFYILICSQKQINTVVQYITEAQAHGTESLLENGDEHGIELSNGDHLNFGSDASSANLRFDAYVSYCILK